MKRCEMIKDKDSFNNIIKKGKFKKNKHFVIYSLPKINEKNKFGIAISKKCGKAFIRNRLKRQTRAIIDSNRNLFQNNLDYIIMIRKGCDEFDYNSLNNSFVTIMKENG